MRPSPVAIAQLQIHACVLLWGITAILGKLIQLPALPLVWWRLLLALAALALLPRLWRSLRALPGRTLAACIGIGALVALHWLTFYASIKLSNASAGAACLALSTVFVVLLEPALTAKRLARGDLLLALLVLPGAALLAGGVPAQMYPGLAIGVLSALLLAIFGVLNKRMVARIDALSMTAIELGGGALALTLLAPLLAITLPELTGDAEAWLTPSPDDLAALLLLALGCTLLPFALSLVALRRMSAFSAQLALNLEPVYAIALAWLLLDEQRQVSPHFYWGAAIIVVVACLHPLLGRRRRPPRRHGD